MKSNKQQEKLCCLFSSHVVFLQTLPKLDRSILSVPVCACVPNLDLYNGNTISEINSNIFAIGVVGKQLPSQSKVVTMCSEFLSCKISHVTPCRDWGVSRKRMSVFGSGSISRQKLCQDIFQGLAWRHSFYMYSHFKPSSQQM